MTGPVFASLGTWSGAAERVPHGLPEQSIEPAPRFGRAPVLHDCGRHGILTSREAAALAGVTVAAIDLRIRRGVAGEAIVAPDGRSPNLRKPRARRKAKARAR